LFAQLDVSELLLSAVTRRELRDWDTPADRVRGPTEPGD
jgi:hypothetical protein